MCVVGRVLPTLGLGFLCCLMYKQTTNIDSIITVGMRISTITKVIVKTVLCDVLPAEIVLKSVLCGSVLKVERLGSV